MEMRLETLALKNLVGKRMIMSLTKNKTHELWKSFMSNRHRILNNIGSDLYSLQVYDPNYFNNFSPDQEFEKWACIEVTNFETVPIDMHQFTLPEGLYAVFLHIGPASAGPKSFKYIFETWFPNSQHALDNRPHFEILGEKYKNEDHASEEEIWIPVKLKE